MKNLIVVGAGRAGQEIFAWASAHFLGMGFVFKGYLDDQNVIAFSTISDYYPEDNDVFICSIGSPMSRNRCCSLLRKKGAKFINLIHPSSLVLSTISSTGVVIAPFVFVSNDVVIGNDVFVNVSSTVGHDVTIGEGSVICAQVDLTGGVCVGREVLIGSHACVIPGKRIGDSAIIGAGSAVMVDVLSGSTVIGVPAKRFI